MSRSITLLDCQVSRIFLLHHLSLTEQLNLVHIMQIQMRIQNKITTVINKPMIRQKESTVTQFLPLVRKDHWWTKSPEEEEDSIDVTFYGDRLG
jgi:hypothetical protein